MILRSGRSALVVVDIQERLMPAIHEADRVARNAEILLQAAHHLSVPILATEQYPRGLGPTVPAIAELLPAGATIEKLAFAATGEQIFLDRLAMLDRRQIVVCGTEAHVCVLQTALGLLEAGYEVFVTADAVSSRTAANVAAALDRLRAEGVRIVTTEMVVFEWMERAGTPIFKTVSALVK